MRRVSCAAASASNCSYCFFRQHQRANHYQHKQCNSAKLTAHQNVARKLASFILSPFLINILFAAHACCQLASLKHGGTVCTALSRHCLKNFKRRMRGREREKRKKERLSNNLNNGCTLSFRLLEVLPQLRRFCQQSSSSSPHDLWR